ncbi:Aquaporin-1, partial [Lasiodiplodia theobromae]
MNINQPSEKYIVFPGRRKKSAGPNGDVENQAPQRRDRRLRGISWMPNSVRNHFIAMLGEFVGTFMFLFFAFSATQIANNSASSSSTTGIPNTSDLLYVALGFGFSLAVNVWAFFRISGGLFNPAVTLGMCLIGAVGWFRGGLIFVTQLVAGIASAGIVSCLFPGTLSVRTQLRGTSVVRGLFIEMFLTAMLVFTVFMLAAEKHKGTFLAPIGIGLAMFIAELSGVYFTGGSLNPARSFGPDVIMHTFDGYHWIYWVGPALGSLLAVVLYRLIKTLEYETANPGQDFDENETEAFHPGDDPTPEDVRRPQVYGVSSDQLQAIASRDGATTSYSAHSHDPLHKNNSLMGPASSAGGTPRAPSTGVFAAGAGAGAGLALANKNHQQQQQQNQQHYHHKQDSHQDHSNAATTTNGAAEMQEKQSAQHHALRSSSASADDEATSSSSGGRAGAGVGGGGGGGAGGALALHPPPPPPAITTTTTASALQYPQAQAPTHSHSQSQSQQNNNSSHQHHQHSYSYTQENQHQHQHQQTTSKTSKTTTATTDDPPSLPHPVLANGYHHHHANDSDGSFQEIGRGGVISGHRHFPHDRAWYQGEDDEDGDGEGWEVRKEVKV